MKKTPPRKMMMMRLHTWQGRYQKYGSKGRKRALFLRRIRKARLNKMKSFASNARSLDISYQNVLDEESLKKEDYKEEGYDSHMGRPR